MSFVKKKTPLKKRWVILIFIILFINIYPLPYYFTKPGDANVLNEIIEVDGRIEDEGSFMLTTVRMGKANLVNYLWAQWSDERELISEELIRRSGETDDEYHHRQLMMMSSSQDLATLVAYQKAGKEAYYENYGVLVTGKIEGMSAFDQLELGDLIIAVDEIEIKTVDELLSQLGKKKKNESVTLTIERDKRKLEVDLIVSTFPKEIDPAQEKVGIGITSPITKRELKVTPPITIDTSDIGGPSAGLMFSLEIYNQLVKEDITNGYQVAGTGTINEEGEVGRIGGIKQKVIAAEREGADFFLAPNESNSPSSNYQEALETVQSNNMNLQLVPVDTFEEALAFLQSLDRK